MEEKGIYLLTPTQDPILLPKIPSWEEMQQILGGFLEQVRVLDSVTKEGFNYSYMYVNETGLLDGLPRNEIATTIYQRNVRAIFPNSANPFQESREEEIARYRALGDITIISSDPNPEYSNDPWIAGNAIYFMGYTTEEIDRYWNDEYEEKEK